MLSSGVACAPDNNNRNLSADTPATVVPSGEAIVIPSGTAVQITHRLGGNFTVTWEFGMARIGGAHAASLGETVAEKKKDEKQENEDDSLPPEEKNLWEALKTVFDPEIPVNIVDLGLVYSLDLEPLSPTEKTTEKTSTEISGGKGGAAPSSTPLPEGGVGGGSKSNDWKVWMKMTLTAPGCGMGPAIAADAKERLLQVRGVKDAQVDIVWDPPWNQNMISEAGKMELGLL